MPQLTYDILTQQNATTTNAIIEHYASSTNFIKLATAEGDDIFARDDEDGEKLQKGIDIAKAKGVLDPNFVPEEYITIDVLGKSPEDVADEILSFVRGSSGPPVVVLCGLSGTGKVSNITHNLSRFLINVYMSLVSHTSWTQTHVWNRERPWPHFRKN